MRLITKLLLVLAFMGVCCESAPAQTDWQNEIGEHAIATRSEWQKLTIGEELVRGKEVQFFPKPNYRLTTDENDPYDLTDGSLSSRVDDRIWFNNDAVGWYGGLGTSSGILLLVDLGVPQPVGQVAFRMLGGGEQTTLVFPSSVEFLASNDNRQYAVLQSMVKLNPAEAEQSDFKTAYYLPEEGRAYVATMVCREPVRARYIALRIRPQASLFIDQISILKASPTAVFKPLDEFPRTHVYTDGIAVRPRHNPFTVTTNISTPNWLVVQDNSEADPAKVKLGFRLELPRGLRVLPQTSLEFKEVATDKLGSVAYEFGYDGKHRAGSIGPLWIEKLPDAQIAPQATVKITGIIEGRDSHSIESLLQLVTIPEVPPLKSLDVSLAWMSDGVQQQWPNFLRDFRKMGFDYVSTFPRSFGKDKAGRWNETTRKNLDFLQQAREAGYGIVYDESPFHVMWSRVQADLKAKKISEEEAEQLFTQIDGKRGTRMNILYRGKYFQDEIKRIAELAALVQPDHVYHDIEWWTPHVTESKKDPRVIAAWKQSGKEWDEYVTDMGAQVLGELVKTMRAAVPQKQMTVGLYNSDPKNKIYNSIFQFDKIYPGIVDLAQPSLYIQGRAKLVADRIRFDYDAMQKRAIIPWLSAGTYGEFEPRWMEPMVLEAILNGARGVTYYWFGNFDPMDFYYHTKALAALAPYEKLLQDGKPIPYQGDNGALSYTAFASDSEALVLVGNYGHAAGTQVSLPLPVKSARQATVDGKPLTMNGDSVSLAVPPGEFRLVVFRGGNR